MFCNTAFLVLSKNFLSFKSFLPPMAVLRSISACVPISAIISAIYGATVRLPEIASSILVFKVRSTIFNLASIASTTSPGTTLASIRLLYLGFSFTSFELSSAAIPLALLTSLASFNSFPFLNSVRASLILLFNPNSLPIIYPPKSSLPWGFSFVLGLKLRMFLIY